jgi:hypothetical protein
MASVLNQELCRKRMEYETALFVSDTYAPSGGEATLEGIQRIRNRTILASKTNRRV